MNRKILLIALVCVSFTLRSWSQEGTIESPTLEGRWVLDSIMLYKYSDNDSVRVTNDLLTENPFISGVFDTIYFERDVCHINIDKDSFELPYRQNGNILDIMLMVVPHTYTVIKDEKILTLYHKYSIVDKENSDNTVFYGVKLIYQIIDKHFDYE
jgi:hypothetical protein